jgi:S-adenosylmethionine:tRNA ribosyltransferase-isomerase
MPVKSEEIENHVMHSEIFELSADAAGVLQNAKKEGSRIVAVGTTSVRVLESSFGPGGFLPKVGETSIYIYPGYTWKCVDALITNFHLPKSSLLLLTCSFGGTDFILNAYEEAVERKYRFYSFGDAMFIT